MKVEQSKLITCILPKGAGVEVVKMLKKDKGFTTGNMSFCRGTGMGGSARRGRSDSSEKEVVTVVVPEDKADEIFEYIYFEAKVDRPHGGFIYMTRLQKSVPYSLPDLPEES